MNKDKALDIMALVIGILATIIYGWLLFNFPVIVLEATAFIPVAVVLAILGWVGYKMVTAHSPSSRENEENESHES